MYPEFTAGLAKLLRIEGIDIALETCGLFDLGRLKPLLHELQHVLFDIKIYEKTQHRWLCGTDNTVIKENLKYLVEAARSREAPFVWPRLPLVPGMTDGQDNIKGWAGFLRSLGIDFLTIVPYHPMGIGKRSWLNLPEGPKLRAPTDAELRDIEGLLTAEGIMVYKPGDEEFQLHSIGPEKRVPHRLGHEGKGLGFV